MSVFVEHASEPPGGLPAAPQDPLPLLASLTKAVPSPLLQWQLLDILYTYCFVMRLYNGEPQSDPQVVPCPGLTENNMVVQHFSCGVELFHVWWCGYAEHAVDRVLNCCRRLC